MEEKEKIKYKGLFQRIWNDQVLSQIISVILLSILTLLYSLAKTIFEKISFKQALFDTLCFKIEIYKILIFIVVAVLIFILVYKWRQKRNKRIGRFNVEQKIGNFSFRELYNALLTRKIETPENLKAPGIDDKLNLLTLFILY